MSSPHVGQTIGHYHLVEQLGEGSMGLVFKAEDTRLNRLVALKFHPVRLSTLADQGEADQFERFTREAQIAAKISHPNVCTIYDVSGETRPPFIAMEYVEGTTLRPVIDTIASSGEHLPLALVLDYARQIAAALNAAHRLDILHRDIKAENVMIDPTGRIRVMDFGLARIGSAERLTVTSSMMGTIGYISPEIIRGDDPDNRSDIFSLGVLFYELLTGSLPFRGAHEAAMMYSVVNEPPHPIEDRREGVPEQFVELVDAMLQKEPDDRTGSISEVLERLEVIDHDSAGENLVARTSVAVEKKPGLQFQASRRPGSTSLRNWHVSTSQKKRELRLFVSSTLQDLGDERDHLIKKVFPEIRALCRERGVTFTEVDLRWGVTHDDGNYAPVIRACLDEVDRCRPYFIGILGDRYGSIPGYLQIQRDPELLGQYPWVEEAVLEEMSIIDMEISYGVLSEPDKATGARFYARRDRHGRSDKEGAETQRLDELKERIVAAGFDIAGFREPATLGELVYDDLRTIIERDFGKVEQLTPRDRERARHEAFALSRRRAYVARPDVLRQLNAFTADTSPPMLISSESGSGKSSLLAYWVEGFRRREPETVVIEHYVGIGAAAGDHFGVIRHICMELQLMLGSEEEIPSDPDELNSALGIWFGYAEKELQQSGKQIVILIDGLNQLSSASSHLYWIPEEVSPHIRLILTSTSEEMKAECERRDWTSESIEPLSEQEIEAISMRYLGEYHKGLAPDQLRRLSSEEKCSHPLFLKTLLEELRLVGRPKEVEPRLTYYLGASDTTDLFQRLLERIEDDYSRRSVRSVLVPLWSSRFGLDERDLTEISGLSRLRVEEIIAGLDYHLVSREGRLLFFHDYLREGVEQRYLTTDEEKRDAHQSVATHYEPTIDQQIAGTTPTDLALIDEYCYHLLHAEQLDKLHTTLATEPLFMAFHHADRLYDLLGYWVKSSGAEILEERYLEGLQHLRSHLHASDQGMRRAVEWMDALGRFFLIASRFNAAESTLTLSYRYYRMTLGPESDEALDSLVNLAAACYQQGQTEQAKIFWYQALDVRSNKYGHHHPKLCEILDGLAAVANREHELDEFERLSLRSLQISRDSFGAGHPHSIDRLVNLGQVYMAGKEYLRAIEVFEEAVAISTSTSGFRHPSTAKIVSEAGAALVLAGKIDEGIEEQRKALGVLEQCLGNHVQVARVLEILGYSYKIQGETTSTIEMYKAALLIRSSLQSSSHEDLARLKVSLVAAYRGIGDLQQAEQIAIQLFPSLLQDFGLNHSITQRMAKIYILILEASGRSEEGSEWRQKIGWYNQGPVAN